MKSFGFHTRRFPTAPEGDLDYCNGKPGSVAAEWLREVLQKHAINTGKVSQEDYGWGFHLELPLTIWVATSVIDGSDGSDGNEPAWGVLVSHDAWFTQSEWWLQRRQGRELEDRIIKILRDAANEAPDMHVFDL